MTRIRRAARETMRHVTRVIVVCLCVATLSGARPVLAQSAASLTIGLRTPYRVAPRPAPIRVDSVRSHSEWLPGFVIGGAIGLISGLQLQHQLNNDSDSPSSASRPFADHILFLGPTLVLAVIGGLIGSSIHTQ